jgi:hypothetical protein
VNSLRDSSPYNFVFLRSVPGGQMTADDDEFTFPGISSRRPDEPTTPFSLSGDEMMCEFDGDEDFAWGTGGDIDIDEIAPQTKCPDTPSDALFPIQAMLAEVLAAIDAGDYDFCPQAYGRPHRNEPTDTTDTTDAIDPFESELSGESDVAAQEPGLPPRELIEPQFPSLARDQQKHHGEPNKLTVSTGRILKALQVMGVMTIAQMMEIGQCDNKRVYDIVNGLKWASVIIKDPNGKGYRYCGEQTDEPLELDHLSELSVSLQAEKQRLAVQIMELRALLAQSDEEDGD